MNNIKTQIEAVTSNICVAAQAANRNAEQVTLLAVSKTKPLSAIIDAYQAGQRCFGENYIQEAVKKITSLKSNPLICKNIEWHFIGPIQSNKTRAIAEHFDWVQSVDRLKIAQRLNDQRPDTLAPLNICLQVNISGEQQKAGCSVEDVFELASQVSTMPGLMLRGIMAIPENSHDDSLLSERFSRLHTIYTQLQSQYATVDTLSMGMTQDMTQAIANGSTMVRIGTAIFGHREQK